MIPVLMRHLILATVGVTVVCGFALLLRMAWRGNVVGRYFFLRAMLVAALMLIPLQFVSGAWLPSWVKTYLQPVSASWRDLEEGGWWQATPVVKTPLEAAMQPIPGGAERVISVETPGAVGPGVSPIEVVLWVYLAGAALFVTFNWLRTAGVWRMLRTSRPVLDPVVLDAWAQVRGEISWRGRVRLLESDRVSAPACWCFLRAAVIVPAGEQRSRDAEHLQMALRHELTHLFRRDPLVAILQMPLVVLYWFHPLIWMFDRVLECDRELSCDALVVRRTQKPRSYALALLEYCRPPSVRTVGIGWLGGPPLAGFGARAGVRRRIEMIESDRTYGSKARIGWTLLAALAVVVPLLGGHTGLAAAIGSQEKGSRARDAESDRVIATDFGGPTAEGQIPIKLVANPDGRDEIEVFRKWFQYVSAHDPGVIAQIRPGVMLTDQETVVSASNATHAGNILEAEQININLPEGSKLSKEVYAERVDPDVQRLEFRMLGGQISVRDAEGVERFVVTPQVADGGSGYLILSEKEEGGEIATVVRAESEGGPTRVRVEYDLTTGIPADEEQAPDGAIRWQHFTPDEPEGIHRIKMQWIYDLGRLKSLSEGVDAEK